MIGRCLRLKGFKEIVKNVSNQSFCSSLAVIKNNELSNVETSQLEKKKIIEELISKNTDEYLVYDKRLDANLAPFSDKVDLEYLDDLMPPLNVTFNLAHYINRMPTLQRLVDLGVNLYVLEQDREIAQYLIRLDFNRDIKQHLLYLKSLGIEDDVLGIWITCNPLIFRESIENLNIRLEYLKSKKFTQEMIQMILIRYPPFLNFTVKRVDTALGFLQREFRLTGNDVRQIISHHPKVIHFTHYRYKAISFVFKEVMGFNENQIREIIVGAPSCIYRDCQHLEKTFDLLHVRNGYSRELIVNSPYCLTAQLSMLVARINYLKLLNIFQPDPTKPCFTALDDLCAVRLSVFIEKCAKTSVLDFIKYTKSC